MNDKFIMNLVTEHKLRDAINKYLKTKDCFFKKVPGSAYMRDMPDYLIIIRGYAVMVELKTETGELTKKQALTIKDIQEKGGGISFVAYGKQDFIKKFDFIYKELLKCQKQKIKKFPLSELEQT